MLYYNFMRIILHYITIILLHLVHFYAMTICNVISYSYVALLGITGEEKRMSAASFVYKQFDAIADVTYVCMCVSSTQTNTRIRTLCR